MWEVGKSAMHEEYQTTKLPLGDMDYQGDKDPIYTVKVRFLQLGTCTNPPILLQNLNSSLFDFEEVERFSYF